MGIESQRSEQLIHQFQKEAAFATYIIHVADTELTFPRSLSRMRETYNEPLADFLENPNLEKYRRFLQGAGFVFLYTDRLYKKLNIEVPSIPYRTLRDLKEQFSRQSADFHTVIQMQDQNCILGSSEQAKRIEKEFDQPLLDHMFFIFNRPAPPRMTGKEIVSFLNGSRFMNFVLKRHSRRIGRE